MPGDNPDPHPGIPAEEDEKQASGIGPAPGTDAQDVTEQPDTQSAVDPQGDTESNSAAPWEPDDPEETDA